MLTRLFSHRFACPRRLAGLGLAAALVGLAACARPQTPPTDPAATATPIAPAAAPSPSGCLSGEAATIVWPQLSDLQPKQAAEGSEVTVIASGGYVQCGASGFNESARSFRVNLDGVAVSSISCYVNHCEGKFTLPRGVAAGTHLVSVEGGSHLTLEVTQP